MVLKYLCGNQGKNSLIFKLILNNHLYLKEHTCFTLFLFGIMVNTFLMNIAFTFVFCFYNNQAIVHE